MLCITCVQCCECLKNGTVQMSVGIVSKLTLRLWNLKTAKSIKPIDIAADTAHMIR